MCVATDFEVLAFYYVGLCQSELHTFKYLDEVLSLGKTINCLGLDADGQKAEITQQAF